MSHCTHGLRNILGSLACIVALTVSGFPTASLATGGADENKSDKQEQAAEKPAVSVAYREAKLRDVSAVQVFSGRVEAIESVQLFARVQGYLKSRNFDEGQKVKQGDLLFELDKDLYANAVDQGQASLKAAEAQETLATQTYDRQKELTERDVQSVARLDDATASLDEARAGVASAQAQLDAAKINLGYTEIRAPIDGLAGRALVSTGDLLGPQSGPLVTIVSQDPMYVSFPVPQKDVIEIQRRQKGEDQFKIVLQLADGTTYDHEAEFAFADNQSTASTNSLLVRVTVPNPDGLLIDKTLVDVRLTSREADEKLTIPQKALLLDQEGPYVFVDEEGKAKRKNIKVGVQREDFLVVTDGLKEGDKVIVDGLQKISPDAPVKAVAEEDSSGGSKTSTDSKN